MHGQKRSRAAIVFLILAPVLLNCNAWAPLPEYGKEQPALPTVVAALPTQAVASPELAQPAAGVLRPAGPAAVEVPVQAGAHYAAAGEPAGCLSTVEQGALQSRQAMLDYAASLLAFDGSFSERILPDSWNAYTGVFSWDDAGALSLSVDNVDNLFLVQSMMDALQVAGFVTWLRRTNNQGLHILAIPLLDPAVLESAWAPYLQAYWESRQALPDGDVDVLLALKAPPCTWMQERGFAPVVDGAWWGEARLGRPNYSAAAASYLAATAEEASRVALRIDWLGPSFPEGPDTMCGPLAWSILHDAGALPLGWGEWQTGPKVFWLAKPETNGRPWSLFPKNSYHTYSFREPLGAFDFSNFPLYPGDFLYTYSNKDGFDHMLVVTEVDRSGNVYTVSNITRAEPVKETTIERVLLLNLYDPGPGIARNQWARDKVNGRTGHAGFDVFRWSWMEKDIDGQPAAYTIQPGDTLGLIAAQWKTPANIIAEYNGVTMDSTLSVGQVLSIPPNEPAGR